MAQKLGELAMASNNASPDSQFTGDKTGANGTNDGEESKDDKKVDDVVDAEFKEVKRD